MKKFFLVGIIFQVIMGTVYCAQHTVVQTWQHAVETAKKIITTPPDIYSVRTEVLGKLSSEHTKLNTPECTQTFINLLQQKSPYQPYSPLLAAVFLKTTGAQQFLESTPQNERENFCRNAIKNHVLALQVDRTTRLGRHGFLVQHAPQSCIADQIERDFFFVKSSLPNFDMAAEYEKLEKSETKESTRYKDGLTYTSAELSLVVAKHWQDTALREDATRAITDNNHAALIFFYRALQQECALQTNSTQPAMAYFHVAADAKKTTPETLQLLSALGQKARRCEYNGTVTVPSEYARSAQRDTEFVRTLETLEEKYRQEKPT